MEKSIIQLFHECLADLKALKKDAALEVVINKYEGLLSLASAVQQFSDLVESLKDEKQNG